MKDILLVAQDTVNVMEMVRKGITDYKHMSYDFIDHDAIRNGFKYKGFGHRAKNFYLKNFMGRNLKLEYYSHSVRKAIEGLQPSYKVILVIRPDLLNDEHLHILRGMTSYMVTCYWDQVDFFPRKLAIASYFDRIFSFDPEDCRKYGLEFRPNFFYYQEAASETLYNVYHLSSLDQRKDLIEDMAVSLERTGKTYLFKGFLHKPFKNNYIRHTPLITYQQMISEVAHCDAVLDIAKKRAERA